MSDAPVASADRAAERRTAPAARDTAAIKAALIAALAETVQRRGLTQVEAARICRTDQPTLSKVLRGRLGRISVDKLTAWLAALGRRVEVRVLPEDGGAPARRVARPGPGHAAGMNGAGEGYAEAALRESEARLRLAVEAAGLGTWDVVDPASGARRWSDEFKALVGVAPEAEPDYGLLLSLMHPDDRERVDRSYRGAFDPASGGRYEAEFRVRRANDRAERWVAARGRVFFDDAGTPTRAIGMLMDVTERKRAEEALRRSEEQLRIALGAARLGSWERDLGTGELRASATCKANLGLPPDATLTFESLQAMRHPDDRERVAEEIGRAIAEGIDYDVESRVIWPDGSVHWLIIRGHALYDRAGQPVRTVGVTLDITERKRMEQALRESEARFRTLADSAPVLIWMSGPDKGGVYFNKTWLDFTGRGVESELGAGWIESVHPEDRPALEACAGAFAARRPFRTEFRLRRHDGAWRWILDTGVPRFAPDGTFAGYIGSCVDITERREAEAALRESEERLKLAQEAAGIGSWDWNLGTGAIRWSPQMFRLFGLDPERHGADPYGAWLRALHPEDRERAHADAQRHAREGEPFSSEFRVVHPDGSVHWILARGRMTHGADGAPARVSGINIDITERKRAEERQRLLLDELNHRVKNTLATVQSLAAHTLRSAPSPEAFREGFEARLVALSGTHNLLTRDSWQGAWLRDVLEQELAPYQEGGAGGAPRCRLRGGAVRLTPRAALTLGMAFHELATNAAKYGALSAPGGRVEVGWRVDGADDGGGARRLRLDWRETGGPPVAPPRRRGFGSRLVERSVASDLDGEVRLGFDPEGVSCAMVIPLAPGGGG